VYNNTSNEQAGGALMMERMSVLPYEWFNKPVRVEAYSGETLHL
jgi:hypothetical protein